MPDLGEREDWFTSVDGFVPSLGMGIAVFDHQRYNHAFVAGHISYKTASERAGYALGFERPLFGATKLYVGGELHDLTASDDQWQVSSIEASLAAIGPRRSFRDYYRRRGVQINAALRVHPQVEPLFAWRGERHDALPTESDFSFWNDDEAVPPEHRRAGWTAQRHRRRRVGGQPRIRARIARGVLPAPPARDAVRRAAERARLGARSAADLARRLDVGDLRRPMRSAATSISAATSSPAGRAC